MNKTGKTLLTFAAIAATLSLGANALLWSRYTPEREINGGGSISRGAYQTALESADASGDTLNNLLLSSTYDPMMRNSGDGGFEPVTNPAKPGSSLLGKTLQVADAEVPVVTRRRRAARPVRRRVVRSCTPTRSAVRSAVVRHTPTAKVAGAVVRPTGPPVSAMDTSTWSGRLRPPLQQLGSGNAIGNGIGNAPSLSLAGPGAVEPTGVVASYPVNSPGATVFSQIGSGAGAAGAGTTIGAISPLAIGATALLGAVVANNALNSGTTGGIANATTGGTTGGGTDVPPIPEPAPVALVATTMLTVAGLMVRARRKGDGAGASA